VQLTNFVSIESEWEARFASLLGNRPKPRREIRAGSEPVEILTPSEMAEIDHRTIEAGVPGIALMARAGEAVAMAARRLMPAPCKVAVLAGPGNNGGDGFVAARALADAGYQVSVSLLGLKQRLTGDAALAAGSWTGPVGVVGAESIGDADLVIDALFGAGLDRPIEGSAASAINAANRSGKPILSVDLPSGIDGATGAVLGVAVRATESVTFFRKKPGHLLFPGRDFAGPVGVADIGIDPAALDAIVPTIFHNIPPLWLPQFPRPRTDGHKYDRGHLVVVSGGMSRTGAARLAAEGGLRAGAGLVSVAAPPDAVPVLAGSLTAIMLLPMNGTDGLSAILSDTRRNALVIGPALGGREWASMLVGTALHYGPAIVLDADALTAFARAGEVLFEMIAARRAATVMTPHDGEFAQLFPDLAGLPAKLDRAREAAARSHAVVVLKGPDTVIAAPDGRVAINDNAPPYLATAGAGDVLSGIIGGLLAQGMPAFEAAAAGVWMHGAAAAQRGAGMISEDLPAALAPVVLDLAGRQP
jgi:hydroxyethylthiazole kinase-like uncharacterized protein yjeF